MASGHLSLLLLLVGLSQVVVHAFFFHNGHRWPVRPFRHMGWNPHQHGVGSSSEESRESSGNRRHFRFAFHRGRGSVRPFRHMGWNPHQHGVGSSSEESRESSGNRRHFRFAFHRGRGSGSSMLNRLWDIGRRKLEPFRRPLTHRPHTPCTQKPSTSMWWGCLAKPKPIRRPQLTTPRPTTATTSTPFTTLPSVASVAITEGVEDGSGVINEFKVKAEEDVRETARPVIGSKPSPQSRFTTRSETENESGILTRGNVDVIATSAKPTPVTDELIILPEILA